MKIRKNENMTIYKFWKSSICLISTLFLWGCSNMKVKDFKPEAYFSHEIESEMAMANAIYYSNNELVKDYIKTGRVDINTPGKYGFTYLMYAIYIQKYDMAKLLLKLGADPNLLSFVNHPVKGNNPDYIQREEGTFRLMPLSFVCGHPDWDIKYIKLLIEYGADINATIPFTPIHELIVGGAGDMERIKYLMKHGLDLNVPDNLGDTPIITAAIVRDLDLVEYFLDYGANPKQINKDGVSLGYELQLQIEDNLGTPEYITHAKAIIERLKKMGITFPAVQENKLEDNGPALSDDKSISQGKTDENKTEWKWM